MIDTVLDMPRCSIITVCYNNREGLRDTAESVKKQTFKDYEFIVIDGGSTDGSAELLKEYASIITYGVSEKDDGIYNAMNKGIAKACGEYCLFLNSGDWLATDKVLERVFNKEFDDADFLYGDIVKVNGRKKRVIRYPDKLTLYDFYKVAAVIHHQATFIKRSLFGKFGYYLENTYMNADWMFFFDAIVMGKASTKHLDMVISVFDGTGTSEKWSQDNPRVKADMERKQERLDKVMTQDEKELFPKIEDTQKKKTKFATSLRWHLSPLLPLRFYTKA